ncbi:MAG TPA: hypothetical protein VFT41_01410, partial [Gemmatimonadaceae bacterium]|nr:hypothetical protein [Gemmatimonadaceae bacterium]
VIDVELPAPATLAYSRLEEDLNGGQAVAHYSVYGGVGSDWKPLARGTTIGFARIDRLPPVRVRRVRLVIDDALRSPGPVMLRLYGDA